VTTGGQFYSVQVYKQAGIGVNEWRVAARHGPINSMTAGQLLNI